MSRPTAEERVASCEHTMLRSAGPTMGGASAHSPTRAVHRKDAIRIAKEHAAAEVEAATAELVRERDTILARAASDREYAQAEREAREQAERERDEARALLRALVQRYVRDSHEGDGIPEDAVEYDEAVRAMLREVQP